MHALIRNQLFAAGLALASACLAVFSAARLFGELSAMAPRKAMQQWAQDGQLGSHLKRQKYLSRLLMSVRVAPWNADRRMDLARFYTWHMHQAPNQSEQHRIYAQRTQRRILEALRQRPSWGFAWAALAENSVISGKYDPVINDFMEGALRYGPFEPGTLKKVILVGMLHWREFPQPIRSAILAAVTRSLNIDDDPTDLIRLAFTLHWQEYLLPLLQTPRQRIIYDDLVRRVAS